MEQKQESTVRNLSHGGSDDASVLQRHLVSEANAALRKGALAALMPAVTGATVIPVLMWAGLIQGMHVPVLFCLLCIVSCSALYLLARRERVHGWRAWAVLLPFVSLPTVFFLMSHALMPSGAATFIAGPISHLYFVTLAVAGFLFDFRLSAVASVVAAVSYQGCFLLARNGLRTISAPDPMLVQEFTSTSINSFKSLMIFFGGITLAALAVVTRRLVERVLREERQKNLLSRLFGQYVSEEVKERLLKDPHAQSGERKEVVVLFSDLRGFTEYSETAAPEEIVERLNAYFDAMVGAITEHGGIIDKFIGDAVMATFGGLVPLENPSASALEAAQQMRQRLHALNTRWWREGRTAFDTGIGLHVGEVVLGAIGSEQRKDFTVIGDAVNTASRVESLTKQYGHPILVTSALYSRLPAALQARCRALGTAQVKGRRAALELYGLPDAHSAPEVRGGEEAPHPRDTLVT
ncbi:adenylate/guanylate cyclase domain-containing protein [Hyalangium rubrum]|uniref:Adenylate/guanylate cyclase domain-containing protein n=1 Tax=Hyalangium rubrum TaxID=3103134 RepID=A0ABU5H9A5_9BACT|nr:adenylate/guanylate cyclase domain-containing protein [Hyalangium sp. s54d21]MDY7230059.1 adenylate/guanylate cyclase domain-containing protein [Hyalangium sp. s54d21]